MSLERRQTRDIQFAQPRDGKTRVISFCGDSSLWLRAVVAATALAMSTTGLAQSSRSESQRRITANKRSAADPASSAKQRIASEDEDSRDAHTTTLARVRKGMAPTSLDELRAIQDRIRELTERIIPATVAVRVGRANGSGVIIDADGHVLTAAHVAGHPGRPALISLPNGRMVRGITMGLNQELDAGLIHITDRGPWPHVTLGKSSTLRVGQYCLATGHPGGHDPDRPPVLRWGRILKTDPSAILTDCTLVGGDSGGPLFDMDGRVIGIHSRIGKNLTINVHVPIDPFHESWDRLARGEVWGILADEMDEAEADSPSGEDSPRGSEAWLGVVEEPNTAGARIQRVAPDSPASNAGLQPGDLVLRIDGVEIQSFTQLQEEVRRRTPSDIMLVQILREGSIHELRVRLGRRLRRTADDR